MARLMAPRAAVNETALAEVIVSGRGSVAFHQRASTCHCVPLAAVPSPFGPVKEPSWIVVGEPSVACCCAPVGSVSVGATALTKIVTLSSAAVLPTVVLTRAVISLRVPFLRSSVVRL